MKKFSLLSRCLSLGMLSAMLGTVIPQVAQAQRSTFLPDLQCVTTQGGYKVGSWDVSIGRELYTSILRTDPMSMTCKLPGGRASLELQYGVSDSSNKPPAKIEVYVDGNQVKRQVGKEGMLSTLLVDVSNGKSLAIDVSCSREKNCGNSYYYFIKFHLIQAGTSPGGR